MAAERNSIV